MKAEGLAAFAFKDVHPDSGYAAAKFDEALTGPMVTRFKQTAKREETQERRLATLIGDSANRLRIKQLRKG